MVTAYSQKDKRWGKLLISSNTTMEKAGCFVTSLAMLKDMTPDKVLFLLKSHKCFTREGLLKHPDDAIALDMKYGGMVDKCPNIVCIAETDHYKSVGVPQHFFVWLDENHPIADHPLIIDSLDGVKKVNPYNIVSYRIYT